MGSETTYRPFVQDKTEFDVFFLGSSHVGCGIAPMELWNEYGMTSYDFAISAGTIPSLYNQFRLSIRHHKPKVAVLDVQAAHSDERVSYQLNSLHGGIDYFPLSQKKYEIIADLFPDDKNRRLEYLFPFVIFHNRWIDMTPEMMWDGIFNVPVGKVKGQWLSSQNFVSHPDVDIKTDEVLPGNPLGLQYIEKFISFCRENDIIPVLISVPYPVGNKQVRLGENSVQALADRTGVSYYNMQGAGVVDYSTDLRDNNSHVNFSGARKVTLYIGERLRDAYGLGDHRNDPAYASWHEDYKVYAQQLVANLRGQSDLNVCLMLLSSPNFTARLHLREDAELDPAGKKLVAQLGDAITIERAPLNPGVPYIWLNIHDISGGADFTKYFWYY